MTGHLVDATRWATLDADAPYTAPSLEEEGFIHCTDGDTELIATANRYYRSEPGPFLALTIDLDQVGSSWRYDDPTRIYPHVYGPVARASILAVRSIQRAGDGGFMSIGPVLGQDEPV